MNREQAENLLAQLLADELDEPTRADLLAYLQTDASLREQLADMRLTVQLLRDADASDGSPTLSNRRYAKLMKLAARPASGSPKPLGDVLFSFRAWAIAAAAAMLLFGAAGVIFPSLGHRYSAREVARASDAADKAFDDSDMSLEVDGLFRERDEFSVSGLADGRAAAPASPSAPVEQYAEATEFDLDAIALDGDGKAGGDASGWTRGVNDRAAGTELYFFKDTLAGRDESRFRRGQEAAGQSETLGGYVVHAGDGRDDGLAYFNKLAENEKAPDPGSAAGDGTFYSRTEELGRKPKTEGVETGGEVTFRFGVAAPSGSTVNGTLGDRWDNGRGAGGAGGAGAGGPAPVNALPPPPPAESGAPGLAGDWAMPIEGKTKADWYDERAAKEMPEVELGESQLAYVSDLEPLFVAGAVVREPEPANEPRAAAPADAPTRLGIEDRDAGATGHEVRQKAIAEAADSRLQSGLGRLEEGQAPNFDLNRSSEQLREGQQGQSAVDALNAEVLDRRKTALDVPGASVPAVDPRHNEWAQAKRQRGVEAAKQRIDTADEAAPHGELLVYPPDFPELTRRLSEAGEVGQVESIEDLPAASNFRALPVNPWELTEKDAQSTFALDTDSASYTLSRRYIRAGYRPPAGAVRMEEFVNAFDYHYPAQSEQTFTVHADAAPAPFAAPGQATALLKIGVKGKVVGRDGRKPRHLGFLGDASGSMAREDRLPLVQYARGQLVRQLQAGDRVSLITYGTEATLRLEAAPAAQADQVIAAVQAVQPTGSTNLLAGMEKAYQIAARHFRGGQVNRVILCSDGVANIGETQAEHMLDRVDAYRRQGITLTVAGFGMGGLNDALLEQLANSGDGNYLFVDSRREAYRAFVTDMTATLQVIARDAKIQVEFNPQRVRRYRLIGYENRDIADRDFRNDAIDAGEVGSGQSATALYELELIGPMRSAERQPPLGTVFVRYRNADTNAVEEISRLLSSDLLCDRTPRSDPRFFEAAGAAAFAEVLRGSPHARDVNLDRVLRVLEEVAAALPLDRQVAELRDLVRDVRDLPPAP